MEEMLRVAQKTEVLTTKLAEKIVNSLLQRRKKFNPLDYLVMYLYTHNPLHPEREETTLQFQDIPFVKEEWDIK